MILTGVMVSNPFSSHVKVIHLIHTDDRLYSTCDTCFNDLLLRFWNDLWSFQNRKSKSLRSLACHYILLMKLVLFRSVLKYLWVMSFCLMFVGWAYSVSAHCLWNFNLKSYRSPTHPCQPTSSGRILRSRWGSVYWGVDGGVCTGGCTEEECVLRRWGSVYWGGVCTEEECVLRRSVYWGVDGGSVYWGGVCTEE